MVSRRASQQLGGFAEATIAWILCNVSMNLPQWRVWYFQEPMDSKLSLTLVGMWRTCVYHEESNSNILRVCYQYTYQDNFIPLDICVAQHQLISTVSVIVALWKLCSGNLRKKVIYNPFFFHRIINTISSILVFISLLYNYLSIFHKDRIALPPSFQTPSFPETQKAGTAVGMTTLSSVLFLVGGTISLCFTLPLHSRYILVFKTIFPTNINLKIQNWKE
ncbi:claudin-34-like [Mesocricetus auratus]|uniref:Claudin-34-like n=1 Tax=Mesocricetus auratus TaxID=10036 RepID=A0A1U7R2E3_MESAU|nr:claudin-34-like [Mesocricetus auratus]